MTTPAILEPFATAVHLLQERGGKQEVQKEMAGVVGVM